MPVLFNKKPELTVHVDNTINPVIPISVNANDAIKDQCYPIKSQVSGQSDFSV